MPAGAHNMQERQLELATPFRLLLLSTSEGAGDMSTTTMRRRAGFIWAIVGGIALIAGVGALAAMAIINGITADAEPDPVPTSTNASASPSSDSSTEPPGSVVDAAVTELGWVAEPITRDEDVYIRAALAAAATFDTTRATRDEWLSYLDTWFTPDTRYNSEADRDAQLEQARLELRQSVVLPENLWNALESENGRVESDVSQTVTYSAVPENPPGDMFIGEADVVLTFTSTTEGNQQASYEQTVHVRVQVLCGGESAPTPGSTQQPGDCKVVRFFGSDGS
ncbi:hypothetical protein M4I32_12405 [Microbacterium sp. LRZ72]|uniref:hypothetical protein n=1 Tax=Microbacterium sp. LRZ72 TaxID=2942481 RepID=UPI0029BB26BC|nr:hypothetical protein [Microbacterium sp. LRZ72]MDX2377602.1 hypothetical protein [Microbacterium sp. LRZ72]